LGIKLITSLTFEGRTELEIPDPSSYTFQGRYAPFRAPVFYNPVMEFSRDIAVAALSIFAKAKGRSITVCDPLAGIGARGIRYAKEVQSVEKVVMGDLNAESIPLIINNAKRNGIEDLIEATHEDANLLLAEHSEPGERFDFIDIDPFGTPMPFVDSSIRALKNGGLLAVTATDTAPLCGVHSKSCIRKYSSIPLRNEFCHETGLRILVGSVVREAAKYEFGAFPVLSYSVDHYFRSYFRLSLGARRADSALSNMGYLLSCSSCLWRRAVEFGGVLPTSCEDCGSPLRRAGPLWTGSLSDPDFLRTISGFDFSYMRTSKRMSKLFKKLSGEVGMPVGFYVLDVVSKRLGVGAPSLEKALNGLTSAGYSAFPTHFHPKGIKTDAPPGVVEEVIKRS
ncbi:MAG: tRNA (guanine(10)-N(2))-dimethyltransferase, partial [Candidatus Verstraetearchaeota archaeon]|nr:tRNA (guanine(10)-N(2))-dimethyltransferase [Candidatus Verstraetearchaeota archaeon]